MFCKMESSLYFVFRTSFIFCHSFLLSSRINHLTTCFYVFFHLFSSCLNFGSWRAVILFISCMLLQLSIGSYLSFLFCITCCHSSTSFSCSAHFIFIFSPLTDNAPICFLKGITGLLGVHIFLFSVTIAGKGFFSASVCNALELVGAFGPSVCEQVTTQTLIVLFCSVFLSQ